MHIGVPKEIKVREYRVGLVPANVRELVANGHEVTIETGAGAGIGMNDEHYEAVGAKIASTAADVFAAVLERGACPALKNLAFPWPSDALLQIMFWAVAFLK